MGEKIIPQDCPICGISTNYTYRMDDGKDVADWFRCQCGVIFQKDKPKNDCYNEEYVAGYAEYKGAELVNIHAARTYANLIEELTYGRRMLEVGFNLPFNINFFRERGWIAHGLDVNKSFDGKKDIIIGNFEDVNTLKPEYSLIWMSHVFEHFIDPIAALQKAKSLLVEDGVLYISTPDIDFINKTGVSGFPHWKKNEHYVMWSLPALTRELERLGLNVIMKRRNFAGRFTSWFDMQILCQNSYF